jgi:hypothetical protein
MRGSGLKRAVAALVLVAALGACDKVVKTVTLPWFEPSPTPGAVSSQMATSSPVVVAEVSPTPSGPSATPETVPNPNANPGAPANGTPFEEKPVNPNQPISDDAKPLGQDGKPVTLPPPPTEPTPAPSATPAPTPSASGSASPSPTTSASATPTPTPSNTPVPAKFYWFRPGVVEPGSGIGAKDADKILVPDMMFPIKSAPTFAQSQVYRWGGSKKGGDQCDVKNFQAPWRDNYCEARGTTAKTAWCKETGVHLGQDLRVGTPEGCKLEKATPAKDRTRYEIVAVEDGAISNVGSFSINLTASSGGRIYRYLHLNMAKLKVKLGQNVKKGDLLGYVSNDFGGTPTTLHLHFELKLNTTENGWQYAPVYSSLLAAYQRRDGVKGEAVADNFAVASKPK